MITEEDDKESKFCFLCQIPCSNVCPHCRLVHYCNEEHFNLHRVNLKEEKVKNVTELILQDHKKQKIE